MDDEPGDGDRARRLVDDEPRDDEPFGIGLEGGDLVAVSWLGFDQPRPLGERETGGGLALPIWISYMAKALYGIPEAQRPMPGGVVQLGGEVYFVEHQPGQGIASVGVDEALPVEEKARRDTVRDQIF